MHERKSELTPPGRACALQKFEDAQDKAGMARGAALFQPEPLANATVPPSNPASTKTHVAMLNRTTGGDPARAARALLGLQRRYGNRYVQRVLELARQADSDGQASPDVEQAIQRARGGGQALDRGARARMESAFGTDFSGVRVHADARADALNRRLNARAFTTGQDIFFRQGAYDPGSSSGRELLAHELTHVVQQNGSAIRAKLVVNAPGTASSKRRIRRHVP